MSQSNRTGPKVSSTGCRSWRGTTSNPRALSHETCLTGALPITSNPRALSHETCLTGALPMGADPQLFNIWRAVGGFVLHFKHVRADWMSVEGPPRAHEACLMGAVSWA